MDTVRPGSPKKLLSISDAAQKLGVSVATLLRWNKLNILKPIITDEGEVKYPEEQLDQFLAIREAEAQAKAEQTQTDNK